ncbi:hypothetical protein GIB67_029241 [Kingdonia uniflora]|uniref:DUF8040 domain-containing protein n=1 Tax=Kingdonia uniflora TaxID=39325 RepID=A0A7J7N8N6_9MAGN|nr:hypothetical protein GIB67_029241 [Kingdonia uniflora]
MYNMMRIDPNSFRSLVAHFRDIGLLKDSMHIDVEEKLAIFMHIIAHKMSNQAENSRFQHSAATTSKIFHEVLDAMMIFQKKMIVPPKFDQLPGPITHHKILREGTFKGAAGAIDGTLISTSIAKDDKTPYRGRGGGECFQNVMAICDFNMMFTYVVAGWEEVAHDTRVLSETLVNSLLHQLVKEDFIVAPNQSPNMRKVMDFSIGLMMSRVMMHHLPLVLPLVPLQLLESWRTSSKWTLLFQRPRLK